MKQTEREKRNIEFHYDLPARFYELMLGRTLGYTCGYYRDEDDSMDTAQYRKMELVCRKLRLEPGLHLLDVGCGWGGFMIHAARRHGVRVTGITLSRVQRDHAREWIAREGLEDLCEVKLLNYRDLPREAFDRISCIGMSEHVGIANMPGFFATLRQALRPGGLFLLHSITTLTGERNRGGEARFTHRYIFPDGQLLFNHSLCRFAHEAGFELLGSENLRIHYVRTLRDWIARMERYREEMTALVNEATYRAYLIFWAGSATAFNHQRMALFQNLFYRRGGQDPPAYFASSWPADLDP